MNNQFIKKANLSIVIPTLNEENNLPLLLESIEIQSVDDCEIIIADANSEDKTIEIARGHDCKVAPGGLPAEGRNNGAKLAKGSVLLFLDADAVLPEGFFEKALGEFEKKELKIASFPLLPHGEKRIPRLLFQFFYNLPIIAMEKVLPHAAMGILIDKELFEKLNGFDENIKIAEDHDLARRAKRAGKYGIIKSSKIFVSDRRFKTDGWLKTYFKYFLCELHMIFIGPVKSNIFSYKFNHYFKNKED